MHKKYITLLFLTLSSHLSAQQLLQHVNHLLSPAEERCYTTNADISLESAQTLYTNPAFTQWRNQNDSTCCPRTAVVYTAISGSDSEGDFIPYEGNGSNDYRIGAYGEYTTPHSGSLSGCIQYAPGEHRNIGWSAMRHPELYLPYISTDSCGGDFKYYSYYAEGNYGFTLSQWTLGANGSFYGEQAYRLTDPRALNNTTWLRFNMGVARQMGSHLLMMDVGCGRNKQHMQLRYWRPGQQDRFFVCYGFGFYDTRQSAVSFGKSRMYYVDEYNARLQYLSPQDNVLRLHASFAYAFDYMQTEESDIYNLYESRTHHLAPQIHMTYQPRGYWCFDLFTEADIHLRNGYENIIEEYLIDKANNIYDFRTIDTRQNYGRDVTQLSAVLRAARQFGSLELSLQSGIRYDGYEETYRSDDDYIKVEALTPHVKVGADWNGRNNNITFHLLYAHQGVCTHQYDVQILNTQIAHLDFQQAFAPYAYRTANLNKVVAEMTWRHQLKGVTVGIHGKLSLACGHRLDDVTYKGAIGYPSTAPMIVPNSDKHQERWGSIMLFVQF